MPRTRIGLRKLQWKIADSIGFAFGPNRTEDTWNLEISTGILKIDQVFATLHWISIASVNHESQVSFRFFWNGTGFDGWCGWFAFGKSTLGQINKLYCQKSRQTMDVKHCQADSLDGRMQLVFLKLRVWIILGGTKVKRGNVVRWRKKLFDNGCKSQWCCHNVVKTLFLCALQTQSTYPAYWNTFFCMSVAEVSDYSRDQQPRLTTIVTAFFILSSTRICLSFSVVTEGSFLWTLTHSVDHRL